MENMRSIFMDIYAFNVLGIHISSNMWPLFHYKNILSMTFCLMGKYRAIKTRSYNQIIILHDYLH